MKTQELTDHLISYQLKANEYSKLIEQAKKDNNEILVNVYTDLLNQCNTLINLCIENL